MPMASPSSSARSDGAIRTPLAVWGAVLAGPAALLALAAAGGANATAAIPLALGSGVAGYVLTRRTLNRPADPAAPTPVPAAQDHPPPFGLILETLPDPLMVIAAEEADDLTGRRFVFANAAARDLFKLQPRGGLLVSALRSPQVLEAVDESLFGGVRRSVDYVGGGAQGREWAAHCAPLGVDERGSRLALLVLSDETDARRSERTRADFLANASHELRTPLASLSGFIETLRGHAKDDVGARDKFLGIMQAQAERMARLIDDLMSLSRIELNEHIAPLGQVDLAMATIDVLDALAPQAKEKAVAFDPVLPPRGAAVVEGDRDQIVQVIQNLVDNAIKYTPRDGVVRVEIFSGLTADMAAAPRDPGAARMSLLTPDHAVDERYASLRVSDRGPGLAREHLPRLTERFYRVEGQKSGERSGTGLGLAIVKHIMNRHRGGMTVESVQGEGAAFGVYLPMARGDGRDPSAGATSPSPLST
ncbi:sensor histidine kinase [Caulobacter rhizosphaerae]|jgi:two-component system phosphate regulon sensor histidine kinase PhoR|uniref:sensor histidine kinase n=1 Tax=Caulobacter rhizosphaerae TaxID=2010972 RepID=UPI0013D3D1F7|nr:ATP-binding protein [Caulobacter rhizosphaerae]GGL30759.1 two-component sensor histidine kinase [Caulobacter rhizosphaerae]